MLSFRFRPGRSRRRLAPVSLAAAALWAFPALAGDKTATPEGAEALKALIAKFMPAAQAGASPVVTVTSEGSHYLISADLSALNALLVETGLSYDPAVIVYKAVEQDDGNWRVAMDSLPRIAFRSKDASGSVELTNFRSAALISPAIAWILSGSANLDKGTFQLQTPKVAEFDRFRPRSGDHRDHRGRRQFGVDTGEGGHYRHRPQSDRGRRNRRFDQFQREGGKGADQSGRRRLQEPQGLRPLEPAGGSSGARRPCRPRGRAQGPAQGAGGPWSQVRRGDRSAEDRRHRVARRDRAGGRQVSAWEQPTPGPRVRSASAFPPRD